MTVSIFDEICRKSTGRTDDEVFEYINSIYPELFTPLLGKYGKSAKTVLFYILYAYSQDSPQVIRGAAWAGNKKNIAELVGIPDHMYEDIVYLKEDVFRRVVVAYLDVQSDRDFENLQMNKDMYDVMNKEMMNDLYGKDDEGKTVFDFKTVSEKRKYKDELLETIQSQEEAIQAKYEYVIHNKDEAQKADKKSKKKTLRIEESEEVL